jgi:hypothetical protein
MEKSAENAPKTQTLKIWNVYKGFTKNLASGHFNKVGPEPQHVRSEICIVGLLEKIYVNSCWLYFNVKDT